jgi:ABC-type uncharacterized transport system fused permease/ATPase subunit
MNGFGVQIMGSSGSGKTSLLRAIAGLWNLGALQSSILFNMPRKM